MLDDCSRLRDVLHAVPTRKYYVPALIVLHWPGTSVSPSPQTEISQDFLDLVASFVRDGSVSSYTFFNCTTPAFELDPAFKAAVSRLDLDFDGAKLTKRINLRGAFGLFEPFLNLLVEEWMGKCVKGSFGKSTMKPGCVILLADVAQVDWGIYSKLVEVYVQLLLRAGRTVGLFFGLEIGDLLPPGLNTDGFVDDAFVCLSLPSI